MSDSISLPIPSLKQQACAHENFRCDCSIGRLTKEEGGEVASFVAEIKVQCAECDLPFHWVGVPGGVSYRRPMSSADSLELRAPIAPGAEFQRGPFVFEVSKEQMEEAKEGGDDEGSQSTVE